MNLLERDSKIKDNIAYPEEGTSHQNMIYILVAFVFLFLIEPFSLLLTSRAFL